MSDTIPTIFTILFISSILGNITLLLMTCHYMELYDKEVKHGSKMGRDANRMGS